MNILFDLITTQIAKGGGSEYVRRIFYSLCDYTSKNNCNVNIIGIVDSSYRSYAYEDLTPKRLKGICSDIIDIHGSTLSDIAKEYNINKIFIGLTQLWATRYDFRGIDCEIITVTHDLHDEEMENIRLYSYLALHSSFYHKIRQAIARTIIAIKGGKRYIASSHANMIKTLTNYHKWYCVTVSEYTKYALIFYHGLHADRIHVLYSPERIMESNKNIDNIRLADIILAKKKYFLLVSAGRPGKNALKAINAFTKYIKTCTSDKQHDIYLITLGFGKQNLCTNHIDLPMLTESDLVHAYKNCYALIYPSFFEGFGYPPLEAMKFGKPILATNVTSVPEILGDAPIYFSPFYENDIFRAFCQLTDRTKPEYERKSIKRYTEVHQRQETNLQHLIHLLTN